jgi:hypothetical protein
MGEKSKGLRGVLGHPLFLLIVGSVIGSLLIPWIGNQINRKKVLQEARLRKAVEIVESNTKTVSQLNGMVTKLSSFHDNNIKLKPTPAKLGELQMKLVEDMDSRWSDFDKTAWWWPEDLNTEAMILGTIPASGAGTLRKDIDAYKKNILDTSNAMKELWSPCISADYDYKDDRINKVRDEMRKKLVDLFNARNQLVTNLVNDFKEPG